MTTYWANFVKTGDPNARDPDREREAMLVSLRPQHEQLPYWPRFNRDRDADRDDQTVQSLTPPALLTPRGPHPFNTFRTDHFCGTWEPLLTFNNGNEPQQP